jgi:hypothetical protein
MKHPIITSIGLAVLASISLVTPALATLSLNYSGYFDSDSLLDGKAFANNTAFSMTALFEEGSPISVVTGRGVFSATSFSFLIDSNTYIGSPGLVVVVQSSDSSQGVNGVGLVGANFSSFVSSAFTRVTPAFNGAQPTATVFSGFQGNGWSGSLHLDLIGDTDGLDINSISGVSTASLTAVPEVTSSFTLLGLITSGLLLRRRTKTLR